MTEPASKVFWENRVDGNDAERGSRTSVQGPDSTARPGSRISEPPQGGVSFRAPASRQVEFRVVEVE